MVFVPTLLPNCGEMESDQLESTGDEGVVQGCGMATAGVSVSKIADKRKCLARQSAMEGGLDLIPADLKSCP